MNNGGVPTNTAHKKHQYVPKNPLGLGLVKGTRSRGSSHCIGHKTAEAAKKAAWARWVAACLPLALLLPLVVYRCFQSTVGRGAALISHEKGTFLLFNTLISLKSVAVFFGFFNVLSAERKFSTLGEVFLSKKVLQKNPTYRVLTQTTFKKGGTIVKSMKGLNPTLFVQLRSRISFSHRCVGKQITPHQDTNL